MICAMEAGIDGSSLDFLSTQQSDMKAFPNPETFAVMPWDTRVGRFICDVLDTNHNPHPLDPRGVLKKVATQAAEMGYNS